MRQLIQLPLPTKHLPLNNLSQLLNTIPLRKQWDFFCSPFLFYHKQFYHKQFYQNARMGYPFELPLQHGQFSEIFALDAIDHRKLYWLDCIYRSADFCIQIVFHHRISYPRIRPVFPIRYHLHSVFTLFCSLLLFV